MRYYSYKILLINDTMVAIIINYSSNEKTFIDLLKQCMIFTNEIIVSYGTHFYDGKEEDHDHFENLKIKYPSVKFLQYIVNIDLPISERLGTVKRETAYWHNLARWTAINSLSTSAEWVFIIDADEIPEGQLIANWLKEIESDLNPECCYKLACYWYFKLPENQATTLEDSILLIHKKHLTKENIFGDNERDHLINVSRCKLLRAVKDLNGSVLWHHFSFVRNKEALIRKLSTWAHINDLFKDVNPVKFTDFIFQNDNVNDIVHRYEYKKVANKFDIIV